MPTLIHVLNIAFLLITLLQRVVILGQNLYRWYRNRRFIDAEAI